LFLKIKANLKCTIQSAYLSETENLKSGPITCFSSNFEVSKPPISNYQDKFINVKIKKHEGGENSI
jgi:hypothetical protein